MISLIVTQGGVLRKKKKIRRNIAVRWGGGGGILSELPFQPFSFSFWEYRVSHGNYAKYPLKEMSKILYLGWLFEII